MDETPAPSLQLPSHDLAIRKGEGSKDQIFDVLRRRWVALTPEERVRQAFTHHLMEDMGYPKGLMANEVPITLGKTVKRCDTVIWAKDRSLLCVVEYKAPHVKISQKVLDQICRYNMTLKARLLMVSNGLEHHAMLLDYDTMSVRHLDGIPSYEALESLLNVK